MAVAILVCGILAGCQARFPEVSEASKVEVRLTRSACFGWCPAYAVAIAGDGSVTYDGVSSVAVSGRFQDRIAPAEVAALVAMFERADFFALKDEYIAEVTDSPFYSVSLAIDGRTKKITDYVGKMAGMPAVVTELEDAVDRAAATAKWVKGTPETIPMLRRTGFDFSSGRAATFLADALEIESYGYASELILAGVPLNGRTSRRGDPTFELLAPLVALSDLAVSRPGLDRISLLFSRAAAERGTRQDRSVALVIAAKLGDAALVRRLIALGVDPVIQESQMGPYTALHTAASAEIARLLLRAGIDPDVSGPWMPKAVLATESEDVALLLTGEGLGDQTKGELIARARKKGWTRLLAKLGA
ncbi:ankyrin repeat domain-containing protein [Inquilinus sp.]|uniref:ankyrin repeat domain-containing protein n=1 Tax=Inquilinus sp. TaxID=1932117 RepID=UPI0031DEFA6C